MTGSEFEIVATRPRSLPKRVQDQFAPAFKSRILNALTALGDGSLTESKQELFGIVGDLTGLSREETIWVLLTRSMIEAVDKVISEVSERVGKDLSIKFDEHIRDGFYDSILVDEIIFGESQLYFPSSIEWVTACSKELSGLLMQIELSDNICSWGKSRLGEHMTYCMRDELFNNQAAYADLLPGTIVDDAARENIEWAAYHSKLLLESSQPIFGTNNVLLREIYIRPRARTSWIDMSFFPSASPSNLYEAQGSDVLFQLKEKYEAFDLHSTLHDWIAARKETGQLRIVCGAPGCGKSSFSTIFAAECIDAGYKVLLFRLGEFFNFKQGDNLEDLLTAYFAKYENFSKSPFAYRSSEPLVLILDGLDELSGPMEKGSDIAKDFIESLMSFVKYKCAIGLNISVILTGRNLLFPPYNSFCRKYKTVPLLMIPFTTEFPVEGEEYYDPQDINWPEGSKEDIEEYWEDYLVRLRCYGDDVADPYPSAEEIKEWDDLFCQNGKYALVRALITHLKLVRRDDREAWWKKWGELTGKDYGGIPECILDNDSLYVISNEPLLNYLIAFVIESEGIDNIGDFSANDLYRKVISGLFNRESEKENTQLFELCTDENDFFTLLEKIALIGWKNGNERRIPRTIMDSELVSVVDKLAEYDLGATRLLMLFYFSSTMHEKQECIEFTHKTFAEYLVAKAIVSKVEELHKEFEMGKGYIDLSTRYKALADWALFCCEGEISLVVHSFLVDEVKIYAEKNDISTIQLMLQLLFQIVLQSGMPMHLCSEEGKRPAFDVETRMAHCAEVNLFATLNAFARASGVKAKFNQESGSDTVAQWLRNHSGLVSMGRDDNGREIGLDSSRLSNSCCSYMDFSELNFISQDFIYTDLSFCAFQDSDLSFSQMVDAVLMNTDLTDARLSNLSAGNAEFIGAVMENAVCAGSFFEHAYFDEAHCVGTNFIGSHLKSASFQGADCSRASFAFCDLRGADFTGANLDEADFSGAIIDGVRFDGAIVGGASLEKAIVKQSDVDDQEEDFYIDEDSSQ